MSSSSSSSSSSSRVALSPRSFVRSFVSTQVWIFHGILAGHDSSFCRVPIRVPLPDLVYDMWQLCVCARPTRNQPNFVTNCRHTPRAWNAPDDDERDDEHDDDDDVHWRVFRRAGDRRSPRREETTDDQDDVDASATDRDDRSGDACDAADGRCRRDVSSVDDENEEFETRRTRRRDERLER